MFLEHQISMLIQFCFAITGINYISQYIEMQNSYYKLFVHVTFHYFTVFLIKQMQTIYFTIYWNTKQLL